ncbi:MAG: hypothetical protein FWE23_10115 [Chitinivibrionia bacterium]|nr:hypothetical protein [Chitinivibrionia bacterium]
MDFKKLKLMFAAILAAVVLMGCSEDNSGEKEIMTSRDIAWVRNIIMDFDAPEGSRLADIKWHNGRIYAALQHFGGWVPNANSTILELNEQGTVLRTFTSNFMNVSEIHIRGNYLFVVDGGASWADIDGGITRISLTTDDGNPTTILDGQTIEANPERMVFISNSEAIVLLSEGWGDSFAARFDLNTGNVDSAIGGINPVSSISLNTSTNTLWLGAAIPLITTENKVYAFSLASNSIVGEATTLLPIYSVASAGGTTLTVESDFSAGHFGLIFGTANYEEQEVIDKDAIVRFVDGNFFILERSNSGALIFLTNDGKIIRQLPFEAQAFNPNGITGNGSGRIFVGAQEDLTIAEFRVSER